MARRSNTLLSALVVGASLWLLTSLVAEPAFLTAAPGTARTQGARTALRGFSEEFAAWKSSLTTEEQELIQEQAENEFDKKFRKSDKFKQDLPQEKLESFGRVLSKFLDAEAEDYKKEENSKGP